MQFAHAPSGLGLGGKTPVSVSKIRSRPWLGLVMSGPVNIPAVSMSNFCF